MCRDLFNYLLQTGGPKQKTIIFCVRDRHADDVATTMNNLYADWCAKNGKQRLDFYAFKCTASVGGSDYIADLRSLKYVSPRGFHKTRRAPSFISWACAVDLSNRD